MRNFEDLTTFNFEVRGSILINLNRVGGRGLHNKHAKVTWATISAFA
jgi:hypothetical protein